MDCFGVVTHAIRFLSFYAVFMAMVITFDMYKNCVFSVFFLLGYLRFVFMSTGTHFRHICSMGDPSILVLNFSLTKYMIRFQDHQNLNS